MTNQELYKEIKELRREIKEDRAILLNHIHELEKEFTLFKGKSLGFMAVLSLIFTIISNVGVSFLTKGE